MSYKECPICMDEIVENINCVITECGHSFHTKCLLTNVSRNGFGCPYCRNELAVNPRNNDEDDDYSSESSSYDDYDDYNESERITSQAFYSMRNMFLIAEGLPSEESEESEENENNTHRDDDDEHLPIELPPDKPSISFISQMLISNGVTMEDMVKCVIDEAFHPEYNSEDYGNESMVVYGKIRRIITRHQRGIQRG
jgi:uncharacterized protein YbaR (Trm112 family)